MGILRLTPLCVHYASKIGSVVMACGLHEEGQKTGELQCFKSRATMKRLLMYFAIALVVFSVDFFGCSKDENVEPTKGRIEEMTERAADVAIKKIRTPIQKARSVRDMEETRMRSVDETLKEQ